MLRPYINDFMTAIKSILSVCIYCYLMAVLAVWGIIWFTGDKWWFGTVLLYGPRWIYALPLIGFVPLALLWYRRWLWPLGLTMLLIVWPVMGLNVPLKFWDDGGEPVLRVLTYNVERWEVNGKEFAALLDETGADLAAVQECASPRRWQLPPQWHVARAVYSMVVSRYPIVRTETLKRGTEVSGLYCVIDTPDGPLGFACVDLLTPRRALKHILDRETGFNLNQVEYTQALIARRWQESADLSAWIDSFPEEKKIIAGDFNLTVDSTIYRKSWSGYRNAYSASEFGYGHTKYTKINVFRYRARIDHILSTPYFRPLRSWTGPDHGSDHLPLLADFAVN
jgi:endonuclease/exonuclease/phosphatase family metal-dependent hydrolase